MAFLRLRRRTRWYLTNVTVFLLLQIALLAFVDEFSLSVYVGVAMAWLFLASRSVSTEGDVTAGAPAGKKQKVPAAVHWVIAAIAVGTVGLLLLSYSDYKRAAEAAEAGLVSVKIEFDQLVERGEEAPEPWLRLLAQLSQLEDDFLSPGRSNYLSVAPTWRTDEIFGTLGRGISARHARPLLLKAIAQELLQGRAAEDQFQWLSLYHVLETGDANPGDGSLSTALWLQREISRLAPDWGPSYLDMNIRQQEGLFPGDGSESPAAADQTAGLVVWRARNSLAMLPAAQLTYRLLRARETGSSSESVARWLGPRDQTLQTRSGAPLERAIPALFTPDGYTRQWLPALQASLDSMEFYSRVLGLDESGASEAPPRDEIRDEMTELYFEDYALTYLNLLRDLQWTPANTAQELQQLLDHIGQPSVLQTIHDRVRALTDLQSAAGLPKPAPSRTDEVFVGQLAATFAPQPGLDSVDAQLQRLLTVTTEYGGQAAPTCSGQEALAEPEALRSEIRDFRAAARKQPEFPGQLLRELGDQAEAVLVAGSQVGRMQSAWRCVALPLCESSMRGRYPFDVASQQDMRMQDFEALFGPGAAFDSVFREHVAPHVDRSTRPWRAALNDPDSLRLSGQTLRFFERVDAIRRAYYPSAYEFGLRFSLEMASMDATLARVQFRLGEQSASWVHGPQQRHDFRWPGPGSDLVEVNLQGVEGNDFFQRTDGPWALHRLIDTATVQPTDRRDRSLLQFRVSTWAIDLVVQSDSAEGMAWYTQLRGLRCPAAL